MEFQDYNQQSLQINVVFDRTCCYTCSLHLLASVRFLWRAVFSCYDSFSSLFQGPQGKDGQSGPDGEPGPPVCCRVLKSFKSGGETEVMNGKGKIILTFEDGFISNINFSLDIREAAETLCLWNVTDLSTSMCFTSQSLSNQPVHF